MDYYTTKMDNAITGDRDKTLQSIRPKYEEVPHEDELKRFEVQTLAPLLDFQHLILLAQIRHYIKMFKPAFNAYNQKVQKGYVSDVLQKDPRIRNSLIASAVSLFTLDEYDFYCSNKSQVNERLISMIIVRLQNQIERLY